MGEQPQQGEMEQPGVSGEVKREAAVMAAVWAAGALAAVILHQTGLISFEVIHTGTEYVAVLAAAAVFLLAWNGRRYLDNGALRIIGAAYLFVGGLNLLHTLASSSFHLFPSATPALPYQSWLAARLLQAGTLAVAPFFTARRPRMGAALAAPALVTLGLLSFLVIRPVAEMQTASGSFTTAGLVVEGAILAALAFSLSAINRQRLLIGDRVLTWLTASIILTILSEVLLSATPRIDGLPDLMGHFLNMAAFYLVYKAVIETSFNRPMELLFSDLLASRASLQREKDFIDGVLDSANAMILVTDTQGRIIRFNRFLQGITGHNSTEMEGRYIWETSIFPGSQEEVRAFFEQQVSSRPPNNFEQSVLSSEGEEIEVTWTTATRPALAGRPGMIIATGIDISDRKKVENELRYLSSHDILTGLYNRSFFEAEMLRLAASDEFPVSIVIGDLDGLKQVNDTEGHIVGDRLIQRAAHILRSSFRSEDIIARIGGDEFAILLPRADAAIAIHSGKRVRSILEAYNQINPERPISLSLGFSTCLAGYQLMEAFKKADTAMYAQKEKHHDAVPGS